LDRNPCDTFGECPVADFDVVPLDRSPTGEYVDQPPAVVTHPLKRRAPFKEKNLTAL
jgi:hypothetical protein